MSNFLYEYWPLFFIYAFAGTVGYYLPARQEYVTALSEFEKNESPQAARKILAAKRRMAWTPLWVFPAVVMLVFFFKALPGIWREHRAEQRDMNERIKSAAKR
jgi:hypothetical protein